MKLVIFLFFIPALSFAKKIEIKDLNYITTCTSTALINTEIVDENGEKKIEVERIEKELETLGSKENGEFKNYIEFSHDIGEGFDFALEFKNLKDVKALDKTQKKKLKKEGTEKLHPFYISFRYKKAEKLDYPQDGVSEFPVVMTRSPASLGGIGTNLRNKFYISANSYVYFQVYCNNLREDKVDPVIKTEEKPKTEVSTDF
jgi:hypothetical protein